MNVLALCAGIGGLELGIKLANPTSRCICYVEGEAYVAACLVKRMEEKVLDKAPIWSDVRTFDGKPWRGKVDCISGGYPCQPFSLAGKVKGRNDPRHLWPHIRRIIGEVNPPICFFENVSNHLRMGFEQVHDDLCSMDYAVASGLFSAEEVGAPHKRERLFILAHSKRFRRNRIHVGEQAGCLAPNISHSSENVSGWEPSHNNSRTVQKPGKSWGAFAVSSSWWGTEPNMGRVANGVANGMDRNRALGNSVVPLVAAYAWRVLEDSLQLEGHELLLP